MRKFFVDPNIAKAKTISTDVYNNQDFFQLAKKKIFEPSWQFIGDTEMVKSVGDCHPFTLLENFLDEPLMLVKSKNDEVQCLSNVCTHRGNILTTHACNVEKHRCKYHGRVFDLNGNLLAMPEFKEVENFPTADDNLHKAPLFQWGNLLFTSLEPNTFGADKFLKDMMAKVSWLPLKDFTLRKDLSRDYYIDANWALYIENYLEGFHIPFIHPELNAVLDFSGYETEIYYPFSNLQLGVARNAKELCFDLPKESVDYGQKIAAYYFWVFPNMMFNFYPWGLSINIIQPQEVTKTKISFITYVWKDDLRDKGAGGNLDRVEMEDEEVVQLVQKGVRSRYYKHGRYSVTKERGTHHFHSLLADFLSEGKQGL